MEKDKEQSLLDNYPQLPSFQHVPEGPGTAHLEPGQTIVQQTLSPR
jgi:hypothetical protein